jgi:hypothetical protein
LGLCLRRLRAFDFNATLGLYAPLLEPLHFLLAFLKPDSGHNFSLA